MKELERWEGIANAFDQSTFVILDKPDCVKDQILDKSNCLLAVTCKFSRDLQIKDSKLRCN